MKFWKPWMKPALFALGGGLAGLGYYYLVGCANGSCLITANPFLTMAYMAMAGLLLSGVFSGKGCGCCGDSCKR